MSVSSKYWTIYRISLKSEKIPYECCLVPKAQEFVAKQLPNSPQADIQAALNSYFYNKNSDVDTTTRALAGLCLRCYVSDPILKACKKIDNLLASEKSFTYQDLLPFVLNDDGQTLVLVDKNDKNQLTLDNTGEVKTTAYKFFTIEILRTYKHNLQSKISLDNWAYLQTKQNPELKKFLSDFGFKNLSDWALLNRARSKQMECLSERERYIVEIFHSVYRRDRLTQRQAGIRKCPDPSNTQLQEMLVSLQERNLILNSPVELMKELKQIATQLRHYDIWSCREPLDIYELDTKSYIPRADLTTDSLSELDVERQEMMEFLHQQLKLALAIAIEQEIHTSIIKLEKSKIYAPLAKQFIPGLQLYYCQGLSLKEIAPLLGMNNWAQARRVLNPGDIINKVRAVCVQQIIDRTLEKAQDKGLTQIPPSPNYLKTLLEQIKAFADEEVFSEAVEEIKAGKNRKMNSLYAQQLRLYFKHHKKIHIRNTAMVSSPMNSKDLELCLPEIIWLEPEHFDKAIQISKSIKSETCQWQTYLNALALIGFEDWLITRIPDKIVNRDTNLIGAGGYLEVSEFKLYLIATEHLLDEVVNLPQAAIEKPELIAHFYVVLEVLEEQEQVIVRGVGRYDLLINYFRQSNLQLLSDSYYQLPLSLFDADPNDLVVYCRLLEPTAIPLPSASTHSQVASQSRTSSVLGQASDTYEFSSVLPEYLEETRIKLSQWLQGVFDEAWLGLDALISPEADLALHTRNAEEATTRGKLINLEMRLGSQTVALLVAIAEEAQEKLGILIQLHPTGGKRYLPSSLKLTLLSKAGKILQEVHARCEDNYIQLIPFKGKPGKRFSIEVSLRNISVKEDFEL